MPMMPRVYSKRLFTSRRTAGRTRLVARFLPSCLPDMTKRQMKETNMGSILLWLLGVPLPIIILIALLT
jgi:hypothetical protein